MRINIVYCNCNVWVTSKNKNFICMIGFFSFWSQLDALGFRTLNFFRYHRKVDRPSGGANHSGCPARRPAGRRNSNEGVFCFIAHPLSCSEGGISLFIPVDIDKSE